MVTKDQLERLKQALQPKAALHYTIEGTVERAVNGQVHKEQLKALQQGQEVMSKAQETLHRGAGQHFQMPRGGHEPDRQDSPPQDNPPRQDRVVAQATWTEAHIELHENRLNQAGAEFRMALENAIAQRSFKPVNTDLGYGAGQEHAIVSHHFNERTQAFAQSMNAGGERDRSRER